MNAATLLRSSVPVAVRGSIVSIFRNNFSSATVTANSLPLSTQLPGTGTQVLFGGVPAPLFYVSPTQINAQVPFDLSESGSVDVVVRNESGASPPLRATLVPQDPGIFVVRRLGSPVSISNPILPGDAFIILATGLGLLNPPVPSGQPGPTSPLALLDRTPLVKVGGQVAKIEFAGLAPGLVGVYQINATAPADLWNPTTDVALVVPGVIGPSGPIGPTGTTGPAGVAGPPGPIGPAGSSGSDGSTGPTGSPGPAGPIGPTGPTGIASVNGVATAGADLDNLAPAAPPDGVNVRFQLDAAATPDDISANLQFATATPAGAVSTAAQTFAGAKTFSASPLTLGAGTNLSQWSHVNLVFEGATDDGFETTFSITDPTAARTVTIPDANSTTVQPDAGAANNFLTAISALGVISKAQPSFADLLGGTNSTALVVGGSLSTTGTGTIAATVLAANGANCAANQFNKGVDAFGAAEGCAALLDADIPAAIARDAEVAISGTANEIVSSATGPATTLSLSGTAQPCGKSVAGGFSAGAGGSHDRRKQDDRCGRTPHSPPDDYAPEQHRHSPPATNSSSDHHAYRC